MDSINQQLGEQLCARGYILEQHLRLALVEQKLSGERLGEVLLRLNLVSRDNLYSVLAQQQHIEIFDWQNWQIDQLLLDFFTEQQLRQLKIFPCSMEGEGDSVKITIATSEPKDLLKHDQICLILNRHLSSKYLINYVWSDLQKIENAIDQYYGSQINLADEIKQVELAIIQRQTPAMTNLPDLIIKEAISKRASDIHITPEANYISIHYRQDGILLVQHYLHRAAWPSLVSRIKIMSGMNIAENRCAQDGNILFSLTNQDKVECRVSVHPTIHGENVVIRILDRRANVLQLAQLNFSPAQQQKLQQLLMPNCGILLLSGPTGCGKTTTLYTLIATLNTSQVNIMTLEDPVEYQLAGIRQTSLAQSKLDFASGVRALLRQDPDIILLGEIRDSETAQMAMRAAMTGHKVLATIHSNSALATINRLYDLGINDRQLLGNIHGICSQRLIRKLCPCCKSAATDPSNNLLRSWLLDNRWQKQTVNTANSSEINHLPQQQIYTANSCAKCNFTGYRGRLPLLEICNLQTLNISAQENTYAQLEQGNSFQTLLQSAIELVLAGDTSFSELRRVVNCYNLPPELINTF